MEASDQTTAESSVAVPPAGEAQPTTDELLAELVQHQRDQRAEIQGLREELAKSRAPSQPAPPTSQVRSQEELLAERMEQVEQHDYYCPGCGKLYDYRRECSGTGAAPHPPLEVVSTDELKGGDEAQHTAAPGVAP